MTELSKTRLSGIARQRREKEREHSRKSAHGSAWYFKELPVTQSGSGYVTKVADWSASFSANMERLSYAAQKHECLQQEEDS